MKLDYNPANELFVLEVERGNALDAETLVTDYGLDFWPAASSPQTAVLSTPQPYAAATFAEYATPRAMAEIEWIVREIEASRAPDSGRHFDVPRSLRDEGIDLWGYQKADLEYMLRRDRVMDADEPGLGKTPTAIVYANEIQAQRVLVLVPASIRFQWIRKIVEWSTMGETYKVENPHVYAVQSAKNGVHPNAAWTVCSYDLARDPGILAALKQTEYDLLICDEAHYLKTVGAKRSRVVYGGGHDPIYREGLVDRCNGVVMLTGTPLPNRAKEIYVHARHLSHQSIDWLSEEGFYDRFNPITYREVEKLVPRETASGGVDYHTITVRVPDEKSGRHAELQNRLRANIMCRHLKREVMTQLKYPSYDLIRLEETGPIRAALKKERLLGIDPDNLEGITAEVLGHISTARHEMGLAMAPQVAEWVAALLNGGEPKVTLFYHHIDVGHILEHALAPYGVCRVDGSTTPVVKDALVQRFRTDPNYRVMMGNVLSLGTGTDGLQDVCWHAVLAEPDWVHGNNQQCFDRLDRGGQKHTVLGDICVAPGSLAERVLASSLRKGNNTFAALDRRVA